ncbi:hypothetical protein FRB94_002143 [Tulasnella sp. JGI-2019a]|nr:hypothetical protein FRB94_002143 [Tulasnella sp. JGI-2019a]
MSASHHKVTAVTAEDPTNKEEDGPSSSLVSFKSQLSQYSFRSPRPPRIQEKGRDEPDVSEKVHRSSISPRKRPPEGDPASEVSPSPTKRSKSGGLQKATPSPKKKTSLPYAPPETYAHLHVLQDNVKPELDILFCGINPGVRSAMTGHHFAHPTNQFYRALHQSGLTKELLLPSEDWTMPDRYNYGFTNIIARPSTSSTELTKAEKVASVPELLQKVSRLQPRIVCFIGREVADAVETAIRQHDRKQGTPSSRKKAGPSVTKPKLGPSVKGENSGAASSQLSDETAQTSSSQASALVTTEVRYTSALATSAPGFRMMSYKMVHKDAKSEGGKCVVIESLFFTAPSTSGLVTAYRLEDRVQLFRLLLEEKNAVVNGIRDTASLTPIAPTLYSMESSTG